MLIALMHRNNHGLGRDIVIIIAFFVFEYYIYFFLTFVSFSTKDKSEVPSPGGVVLSR